MPPDATDAPPRPLAEIQHAGYWLSLDASQSISDRAAPDTTSGSISVDVLDDMRERGYVVVPPQVPSQALDDVVRAMDAVERAGWLPVFSFVFDAPWRAARLSAVQNLAQRILGSGCHQMADFWAYKVMPGERGYRPHREVGQDDMVSPEGDPRAITVWLALSDATLENSCIHVIPRDLERHAMAMHEHADEYGHDALAILPFMLHRVRALPVPRGALVSWHHLTLHWGSFAAADAPFPRLSVSFEFIRGDVDPAFHPHTRLPADVPPHPPIVLDPRGPLPTLAQRLFFIARNIRNYRGRGPDDPFQRWATAAMQTGFPGPAR